MSVIPLLATSLGHTDEQANITLAEAIVAHKNTNGIRELVDLLNSKDKGLKSDALKTLYEIGEREPGMIAPFLAQFKNLLTSSDNRMVWGAMCAIDAITGVKPEAVYILLPQIMAAVDKGSVITRDHAVKVLVKTTFPLLLDQLNSCPVNQLPMYAELVATITKGPGVNEATAILSHRLDMLPTPAKRKRVEKVLARLAKQ